MNRSAWEGSDPKERVLPEEALLKQLAWPRDWTQDKSTSDLKASQDLDRLVHLGLPFRTLNGIRHFDPYEPFTFMRFAFRRYGDPLWSEYLANTRACASEFAKLGDEQVSLEFELERRLDPRQWSRSPVYRVQLPIPNSGTSQTVLEIEGKANRIAALRTLEDRLSVSCGSREIPENGLRLGYRCRFTTAWTTPLESRSPKRTQSADLDKPGIWLDPEEGLIRVSQRIKRLAHELNGGRLGDLDSIRSFWNYIFENLVVGRIHPHLLDLADPLAATLEKGFTDCLHGSALLAALCRAVGIPSRLVSGYFVYNTCQTQHFWAEAYLPNSGWTPFDLWSWVLADGDLNNEWCQAFFGRVDPRLVVERLPRKYVLLEDSIRAPSYFEQRPTDVDHGNGVLMIRRELESGKSLVEDRVKCRRR